MTQLLQDSGWSKFLNKLVRGALLRQTTVPVALICIIFLSPTHSRFLSALASILLIQVACLVRWPRQTLIPDRLKSLVILTVLGHDCYIYPFILYLLTIKKEHGDTKRWLMGSLVCQNHSFLPYYATIIKQVLTSSWLSEFNYPYMPCDNFFFFFPGGAQND